MTVTSDDSVQSTRSVQLDIGGTQRHAASMSVNIQPGHAFLLSVNVPGELSLDAEQRAAIAAELLQAIKAKWAEAAAAEIPLPKWGAK